MDSWGTETEMICSNSFLDEKTGSGLGSSLPRIHRWWTEELGPLWDSQGLVLYSLSSQHWSFWCSCVQLSLSKVSHYFLILKEPLKEEQTCLQVQVAWQECALCRNKVIVLPLWRARRVTPSNSQASFIMLGGKTPYIKTISSKHNGLVL